MSPTPTPPPAGWYPSPDGSASLSWWDGARWAPGQPPAADPGLAKLATATQVLVIVCGVLAIITIGVETFGIGAVTGYLAGLPSGIELINSYDRISMVVALLSALALIATGVVWVIWQYRAAKHVLGQTRRTPGWHVGSWFVPVVALWFPYQNISDLWRAIGRSRPSWQIAWWLCWLVSGLLTQTSTRLLVSAESLEVFRAGLWLSIVGELLLLAAAPMAWLIVRGITQGVSRSASGPVRYPAA